MQAYLQDAEWIGHHMIKHHPNRLALLHPILRNNKSIVLKAVHVNPQALQHASRELQDDEEVVDAACLQCWSAVLFASNRIQRKYDRPLVSVY